MHNINRSDEMNDSANDKVINTPYDDVYKTLLNDCTNLIIPVVNEIFDENYTGQERIEFLPKDHIIHLQDNITKEKRTDSCFEIQGKIPKKYHIECQSASDQSMALRMVEYDIHIALDEGEIKDNTLVLNIPRSAVLYLRHTKNTPDALMVQINTPEESFQYKIPVMKAQKYTIEEIFEKNLLFLIPFHIFCYEKEFPKYEDNPEKLQHLKERYAWIKNKLENLCMEGKISEFDKRTIIDMTKNVIKGIAYKYQKVQRGVTAVMGGKVLEHEAKTILRRGITQGRMEGRMELCLNLLSDNVLNIKEAAKRLGVTENEVEYLLEEYKKNNIRNEE